MHSTPNPSSTLSPAERAAISADLHDRARRQAHVLRRQAVDAFWYGVYRMAMTTLRAARVRVLRLAPLARLSRHPSGV